jgi:hypothetical protein
MAPAKRKLIAATLGHQVSANKATAVAAQYAAQARWRSPMNPTHDHQAREQQGIEAHARSDVVHYAVPAPLRRARHAGRKSKIRIGDEDPAND